MRYIYISPHLDDAVLSAGGLIYEQAHAGHAVEIWTMMCGFPPDAELSPFAQVLHFEWGISAAEDLVRARRAEDVSAAKIIGAKTVHFDFLDCIYRRGKNGAWLYPMEVFVPPHEDEPDLPARIADAITARLLPDDQLICQFAVGAHVDHVTVRRAVDLIQRPKFYDADIPYLFNTPDQLAPQIDHMKETVHSISDPAVEAWQNGIAEYKSQINGLFDSDEDMRTKIKQYVIENNGVRLWTAE